MCYDKLVRNKIPDIIRARGKNPVVHIADDTEYWQKLKEKLLEEVKEFDESEDMVELADILEVIDAICIAKQWEKKDVLVAQEKKAEECGRFEKRIILDEA